MIKLISKGVYYSNGKFIKAKTIDESAKKGTMAYKILKAHNLSLDDKKLNVKFDEKYVHLFDKESECSIMKREYGNK